MSVLSLVTSDRIFASGPTTRGRDIIQLPPKTSRSEKRLQLTSTQLEDEAVLDVREEARPSFDLAKRRVMVKFQQVQPVGNFYAVPVAAQSIAVRRNN
jgi:hypothetical protein